MSRRPTLFLDYDGVLHADAVFIDPRSGLPVMSDEFGTMFACAPLLETVLLSYPTVEIVLSTSWASVLGFESARDYLPPAIAARVVDCVWRKNMWTMHGITPSRFFKMTRYEQVMQYVMRKNVSHWVAIDNDANGWPQNQAHHFVKTADMTGLSVELVQIELRLKLDGLVEKAAQ